MMKRKKTDFPEVLVLGRQGKENKFKIGEYLQEYQKDELQALFAKLLTFSQVIRESRLNKMQIYAEK